MFFGKKKLEDDVKGLTRKVYDYEAELIKLDNLVCSIHSDVVKCLREVKAEINDVKAELATHTHKPDYIVQKELELEAAYKRIDTLENELDQLNASHRVDPELARIKNAAGIKPSIRNDSNDNSNTINNIGVTTAVLIAATSDTSSYNCDSSRSSSSYDSGSSYSSSSYDSGSSYSSSCDSGGGGCGCD